MTKTIEGYFTADELKLAIKYGATPIRLPHLRVCLQFQTAARCEEWLEEIKKSQNDVLALQTNQRID